MVAAVGIQWSAQSGVSSAPQPPPQCSDISFSRPGTASADGATEILVYSVFGKATMKSLIIPINRLSVVAIRNCEVEAETYF